VGFFLLAALFFSGAMTRSKNKLIWRCGITAVVFWLYAVTQQYNMMAKTEESYCHHWLKFSPGNNIALTHLAKIRLRQGRFGEALAYYRQAISSKHDVKDSQIYRNIATVYDKINDLDRARQNLERSLALDPRNFRSLDLMGVLLAKDDEFEEAEHYFLRSLAVNPYFIATNENLRSLYVAKGDYRKAVDLYERYAQLPLLSAEEERAALDELDRLKRSMERQNGSGKNH
jgi:tetratricopeptide (TPR) repeat protein